MIHPTRNVPVEGLPKSDLGRTPKFGMGMRTDDNSDDSSLLSDLGITGAWNVDDEVDSTMPAQAEANADELFHAKWDALERELAEREERFKMITAGKHSTIVRQMRQREILVGLQKREELLLDQLEIEGKATPLHKAAKSCKDANEFHCSNVEDAHNSSTSGVYQRTSTWCPRMYDAVVFELHTTLPASMSLALHCAALIVIYDGICECARLVFAWVRNQWFPESGDWVETAVYSVLLVLGISFMRITGYLYWWLSDQDYACLKFDYHNRIRLGYPGARILQFVRRRTGLRVFLYMVGYFLVYLTAHAMLALLYPLCSQHTRLARFLPSKAFDREAFQTVDMAQHEPFGATFPCNKSCQEEIERRDAAIVEMLRIERECTFHIFAKYSYSCYWGMWALSWSGENYGVDESVPLFNNAGEICFAIAVVVTGVGILRLYGFVFLGKVLV